MTNVPSEYVSYVDAAAKALGISSSIVAAQINMESGFNPNAVSPAGAEGIAQFEPATFSEYGSGSPYNVADAFAAYTKYMGVLLKQYNGNVAEALSAYNSGSPSAAISSYADPILSAAGTGLNATSTGVSSSGSSSSSSSGGSSASGGSVTAPSTGGGSVFSWPSEITGFFSDSKTFIDALLWIVNPASWLRIGSFFIALILLAFAMYVFTKVGSDEPLFQMPSTIPVPV